MNRLRLNNRCEIFKIIKVVRSLYRLKKEIGDTTIKDIRNSFRLKKEMKQSKTK